MQLDIITVRTRQVNMINKQLKKELQIIANQSENTIEKQVALEALDKSYDNPKYFFSLLFKIGCRSGMVNSLIYYTDTHTFFDNHYDEIEELRTEYEDNIGVPLPIKYDLKNTFAWFAFEEIAYQLANKFDLTV